MPTPSELVREAFLATAAEARGLIAERAVAARWREPSALAELDVGAVAGHLARAAFVVTTYLDAADTGDTADTADTGSEGGEGADDDLVTADAYFERVIAAAGASADDMHAGIRARAAEEAADGQEALLARLDATLQALDARLASEPAERTVTVALGITMPLDEYLVTRMIELVVHSDDLAASAGLETPEFDALTMACVIGCMLAMVRARNGDLAVMRGFARRERDAVSALRAF
ncbi:MAG TPA: maleylpyruvate isomerase N-terminal domain-containing protein [Acidimicrobiia bacterium]